MIHGGTSLTETQRLAIWVMLDADEHHKSTIIGRKTDPGTYTIHDATAFILWRRGLLTRVTRKSSWHLRSGDRVKPSPLLEQLIFLGWCINEGRDPHIKFL